ncbi:hypothetical protein CJ672_12235, partial [Arcobacter cryaerophilus gv. occultus]
ADSWKDSTVEVIANTASGGSDSPATHPVKGRDTTGIALQVSQGPWGTARETRRPMQSTVVVNGKVFAPTGIRRDAP